MICICWVGFPQYGARCISALVKSISEKVVVVATRPNVPVRGMDRLVGCKIHWISEDYSGSLMGLLGECPRVMTVPGWRLKLFNRFRDEARTLGGHVFAGCDNNFQFSFREILKAVYFRLFCRNHYDGFWVPGVSGRRLMRFYGVDKNKIFSPSYSADGSLFFSEGNFLDRANRIIYVGQFCDRKNIVPMCRAFLKANEGREWKLEMCGCGPQKNLIPSDSNIEVHDFVQPEELAKLYRGARGFVLASKEEHWGLVVHEAALSGCVLLLSNRVGAKDDMLGRNNGFVFDPFDEKDMQRAFRQLMDMSDQELLMAHAESLRMASEISIQKFADSVKLLGGIQ